jgi:hypothetical protein
MPELAQEFTPQQSEDAGHRPEPDDKASHTARFYEELYSSETETEIEREPEHQPRPPELRFGYRQTGSNVYQLQEVWREAPALPKLVAAEARQPRPRSQRRAKPAAPRYRYRTGRAVATLFAVIGWVMVVAALAATLMWFTQPALASQYAFPNLVGGVAGALFAGLLTVAIGLAVRAHFDQVSATREMLAMQQRGRVNPEQS